MSGAGRACAGRRESFHVKHASPAASADEVLAGLSDTVRDKLATHLALLEKWQPKINLVGGRTLAEAWTRHVADSAQLFPLLDDPAAPITDLGSGAGFPGLVLAHLGASNMRLVESDQRKAVFLREVIRETGTSAEVVAARAETLAPASARVVTARALAALPKLLDLAVPLLQDGGYCLFLKGRDAERELTESRKSWIMQVERVASATDPHASVLKLTEISPYHGNR